MKMDDNMVEHEHAGNGWVVVQDTGQDCVHVMAAGPISLGTQAFLAWNKKLKTQTIQVMQDGSKEFKPMPVPIPEGCMDEVRKLRADLASGKKKIVNTRIVKA